MAESTGPKTWQPESVPDYPRLRQSAIFPRSVVNRLLWTSVLLLAAVPLLLSGSVRTAFVVTAMVAVSVATVVALAKDYRVLARLIRNHPPVPAVAHVNVRIPMDHLLIPYLTFLGLSLYLSGGNGFVAPAVFFIWVLTQGPPYLIRHLLLPSDSVEARTQRDAAALSFLIVFALLFGSAMAAGSLASTIEESTKSRILLSYLPSYIGLGAALVAAVVYGLTYWTLKRKRS